MSSGGAFPANGSREALNSARRWRVLHACERARDVLPLVEGQIAAGMRPYIVTPQGAGSAEMYLAGHAQDQARALSLLRSWQDVRNWRKSILDCDPDACADVVHAHSFAAGMAGVRSFGCVVYDLAACIEELAISTRQAEAGSWMGRSFRVAEQFVLSRASAVVVHSNLMKQAAVERSAPAGDVFVIPDPLPEAEEFASGFDTTDVLSGHFGFGPEIVAVYAPELLPAESDEIPPATIAILQSFSSAAAEIPELRMLTTAPADLRGKLLELAGSLGISGRLVLAEPAHRGALMQSAHVVIASGEPPKDPVVAREPNYTALEALQNGTALLAADVPRNREASPNGQGCLWFDPHHARDLAARLTFLARHADFRHELGASGRHFIIETRSGTAIGKKYAEVYRHAVSRRRTTGLGPGMVSLQPATNWGA
ncbi:MAG TPA: glycosyltransferase [Terriglobales bacterium]|nr:glycosyltransferase [Terriglobales bacterium]